MPRIAFLQSGGFDPDMFSLEDLEFIRDSVAIREVLAQNGQVTQCETRIVGSPMIPDLVYDVGMNHGEDTSYYLKQGYRVIAVEANPALTQSGRGRFRDAIAAGTLTVLNVGIGPVAGTFDFWVNDARDEFSSFIQEVGCRNGARCHTVPVRCVPFRELLAEYGVPFYLKIDIEGYDIHCLTDLNPADLPRYVSVEAHELDYLCILSRLGYNAFKCVDQASHNHGPLPMSNESALGRAVRFGVYCWRHFERRIWRRPPRKGFPEGCSGPIPVFATSEWRTLEEVAYDWLHFQTGHTHRGSLDPRAWFDFHATIR